MLVIALGFRQSVGDSFNSGYLYIFHRPVSRSRILLMKIFIGVFVYLICGAIATLSVALWAQTPGTHASPFEWSMTLPVWQVWLSMPIVYLGAVLSGIRSAHWAGTRIAPLVGATIAVAGIQLLPQWWIFGLLSVLIVGAVLFCLAIYVIHPRRPPPEM